jgi:hypothetical protein
MKAILALVLAVSATAAWAESSAPSDGFFARLYKALTTDTAQKYAAHGMKLSSVAAVRGASLGDQDPAEPYWKGGMSEEASKRQLAERKEFLAAVQLAVDGNMSASTAALEKFQKDHPKSAMLPDVKEALVQTKAAQASASKDAASAISKNTKALEAPEEGCSESKLKEEKPCDSAKPGDKPEKK